MVAVIATTVVWASEKIQDHRQYMIPLAIQAACPVLFGGLSLLLVESPVWYITHGRIDEARRTLLKLRNGKAKIAEAELLMFQAVIETDRKLAEQKHFWRILDKDNIKRTMTAATLLSASQVGGQILSGTYSTVTLVQAGVGNPFQITVIITCLLFLGTLVGPFIVDRVGRRPVALIGFTILLLLNLAAGSLAAVGLTTESQRLGLAGVFIVFSFFNAASFQSL